MRSDADVRGWLDPADHPFCALLEASYPAILKELERVIQMRAWIIWAERPYTPASAVVTGIGADPEPHWKLFGLYLHGKPIDRHCKLCPDTARVLRQTPKITKAAFACLEAGGVIKSHIGHNPHNNRYHLGLIIPPGDCGMKVSDIAQGWVPGKATIFHDNQVHEAWNRTTEHRFILIVDVDNRTPEEIAAAATTHDDTF